MKATGKPKPGSECAIELVASARRTGACLDPYPDFRSLLVAHLQVQGAFGIRRDAGFNRLEAGSTRAENTP
ncbi:MAG: hypothetical protein ABSH48_11535 [Verrucomicrobiota bacterium]